MSETAADLLNHVIIIVLGRVLITLALASSAKQLTGLLMLLVEPNEEHKKLGYFTCLSSLYGIESIPRGGGACWVAWKPGNLFDVEHLRPKSGL